MQAKGVIALRIAPDVRAVEGVYGCPLRRQEQTARRAVGISYVVLRLEPVP